MEQVFSAIITPLATYSYVHRLSWYKGLIALENH